VTIIMVTVYTLIFTDTARRQYERLNPRLRKQVDRGLHRIVLDPTAGKPLREELKGIWSERVATFRILYKIMDNTIEVLILVIEHRKTLYGGH
jgi:mRNA interferase RelE/StbE